MYRFSPVNQTGINLTAAYWNPILAWVSERSGVRLVLKIARTSAETTAFVLKDEAEFVFTNHLFSPEREQLGWKVFGRRFVPPIHGQIIVPADSPVTSLAQLDGKEVSFPGPEAFVAYKVPYAQLLAQKVNVKVSFGGNLDGAMAQMYSGRTAACGVNSQIAEGHARRENKRYRVSSQRFSRKPLNIEFVLIIDTTRAHTSPSAEALCAQLRHAEHAALLDLDFSVEDELRDLRREQPLKAIARDRVPMDCQHAGPVFQVVFHLKNVRRQFSRLSDRHESGPEPGRQGATEDEPPRLDSNDLGNALAFIPGSQLIGNGAIGLSVFEEGGNVVEQNAGLRKVGDFSNEGFVVHASDGIGTSS